MRKRIWLGAVAFGMAVGFVAAVSNAKGTATAMLGYMFALLGGSYIFVYAKITDARHRNEVLTLVGCAATGVLLGLGVGFTAKYVDRRWLEPTLERAGGVSDGQAAGRPEPSVIVQLQGASTTKLKSLRDALEAQLAAGGLPPETARKLSRFADAIDAEPFNAATADVAALVADPRSPLRDDFRRQFRETFGDPSRDR